MSKSTRRRKPRHHQSAKPHPDYPLTAHPSGRWCKKIKGRLHYFGPLDNPQAALEKWLREKDELLAGRIPRERDPHAKDAPTLCDLGNAYLTRQRQQLDRGMIVAITFADSAQTCASLLAFFGPDRRCDDLLPADFASYYAALEKKYSRTTVGNTVLRTRAILNFAVKRWADAQGRPVLQQPIACGPDFVPPGKQAIERAREGKPARMFSVSEIHTLLAAANVQERAWILLGCNGGIGNTDLSRMPLSAVDLNSAWLNMPRTKTGQPRRVPLWTETVQALRAVLFERPTPNTAAENFIFVMSSGRPWCVQAFEEQKKDGQTIIANHTDDALSKAFGRLLKRAGIERKAGVSFYSLRHFFRTTAADSCDAEACDSLMGHRPPGQRSTYVHKIADERLRRVVDHVHGALFGTPAKSPEAVPVLKLHQAEGVAS